MTKREIVSNNPIRHVKYYHGLFGRWFCGIRIAFFAGGVTEFQTRAEGRKLIVYRYRLSGFNGVDDQTVAGAIFDHIESWWGWKTSFTEIQIVRIGETEETAVTK